MSKFSRQEAIDLHQQAVEAGLVAMQEVEPVAMVVGSPTHPLGSDVDPRKKTYCVPGGLCGIGSVKMPANTTFARHLIGAGVARKNSASPGCRIYIFEGGQSYEKKYAFAGAYVGVLRDAGVEKVYADVRVD